MVSAPPRAVMGLTERLVHLADADRCLSELAGEGICMVELNVDVDRAALLGDGRGKSLRVEGF